jgi:uncharacterized protein YecE (DUF72 family)
MTAALSKLAAKGIYLGTSSRKYAGWRGMLYDEQRYITRGKVAETRFERECLYEEARAAAAELIKQSAESGQRLYIYINNRLEGNALLTIQGVLDQLGDR